MAKASVVTSQTDFSAGEIDVSLKRADQSESVRAVLKSGARQMSNLRILNSKSVQNRPGRRALFSEVGRVDEVLMSPGNKFFLCFGQNTLKVYNSSGTQVFSQGGFGWTTSSAKNVVWAQSGLVIYITGPISAQEPVVLTWDGVSTWTAALYAATVTSGNQKRTFFYRISPKGVTMLPSATTGAITLTFGAGMNLVAGHVGTRMRFVGRQVLITAVTSPTTANATVQETLPPGQNLTVGVDPTTIFAVGDVVRGTVSGAQGIVSGMAAGPKTIGIQLLSVPAQITNSAIADKTAIAAQSVAGFSTSDTLVGAGGSTNVTAVATIAPQAVTVWDDEVMNALRGFPQSCFFDQNRLGFCNFPALPQGIGWSAVALPNDLYVDAYATAAMLELAPKKAQVLFVAAGAESNEFVFCDNAVYYIPISATNPLKPGSVAFNFITADGSAQVQPRLVDEVMIYISAGSQSVVALTATGSYTRFYRSLDLTELHTHLLNSPIAIAVPSPGGTFSERYIYVLNTDGSVLVGKYAAELKDLKAGVVGWLPWSGGGTVAWIGALSADVIFTTSYAPNGITAVSIVEILDATRYLDASQLYNTQPAGLPIPGGKGPLWWLAGGTVDVMDGSAGTRMMGTYTVDANGFLVPQNNAGEDFTSANLVVGQAWTATLEPFIPMVQAGQDVTQRMWPRRLLRVQVFVQNSSGFLMERLYTGQSGPNLPAVGTVMKTRRIATWNQDEDPTQPPTLRNQSYLDRPLGRAHDPRWAVVKDTPGPLTVLEIATEVTV